MTGPRRTGALAGLLVAIAAALGAPALAAPAHVSVRVEGAQRTILPRTAVTTSSKKVVKDGTHACNGTSALGALDVATDGDWAGTWASFGGYLVDRVGGETHTSASGAASGSYWAFWLNYRFSSVGLCDARLQDGDDVLLFPDCFGADCVSPTPLRVHVPARAVPGRRFAVRVTQMAVEFAEDGTAKTTEQPAPGADVVAAGERLTADVKGVAHVTATGKSVAIRADKPDHVRSATERVCLAAKGEDRCDPRDLGRPVARIRSVRPKTYLAARAPRRLAGTVELGDAGLDAVRLRLQRRADGRCQAWSGTSERFRRVTCGKGKFFDVGDRAAWSYLLPERLGPGRYVLDVVAVDQEGAESRIVRDRSRVAFRVR